GIQLVVLSRHVVHLVKYPYRSGRITPYSESAWADALAVVSHPARIVIAVFVLLIERWSCPRPECVQGPTATHSSSAAPPNAPNRSCCLTFSVLNRAARSRIVSSTFSGSGSSPLIQRSGLIRATTNDRRYGLCSPRSFSFSIASATFSSSSNNSRARC